MSDTKRAILEITGFMAGVAWVYVLVTLVMAF